jgi:hypothetical protein
MAAGTPDGAGDAGVVAVRHGAVGHLTLRRTRNSASGHEQPTYPGDTVRAAGAHATAGATRSHACATGSHACAAGGNVRMA